MLISRISEDGGMRDGQGDNVVDNSDHSHEYQTASELFDLMARNHNYDSEEDETLTTRDLVLIYKNIDLGTKLMSNANDFKKKIPNQYVESIVYEDLDSDSELGEICSSEDIHNIMLINKERIDLLTKTPCLDNNTLCHKFGDIEIRPSNISVDYDRNFVLKEPLLQCELNNLNLVSNSNDLSNTTIPISLLDYICCKRLDNYIFNMDNIIRYVRHTIDQLKRISNGDYLTEKAQERWREVNSESKIEQGDITGVKILATKTSIPLYVERKLTGNSTKWNDLVHSAIDIRSLSKILEKKIVVEVPKILCGPFALFSKYNNDNLIIRCKRGNPPIAEDSSAKESHLDVIVQLNCSEAGLDVSEINPIMIIQNSEKNFDLLSLPYKSSEDVSTCVEADYESATVIEINDNNEFLSVDKHMEVYDNINEVVTESFSSSKNKQMDSIAKEIKDNSFLLPGARQDVNYFEEQHNDHNDSFELSFEEKPLDYLNLAVQNSNIYTSLLEENVEEINSSEYNKRPSTTPNRIKSPYENKSHILEEKKRKKFLEIRQRRQKRKLALTTESCKVNKHKYPKTPIPPQTANSVTKLSITNKSFYNSIYGHSGNLEQKSSKFRKEKDKKDAIPEVPSDVDLENQTSRLNELDSEKYINKSYYLDNAVTEMMYMDMNKSESHDQSLDTISGSDLKMNLSLLSQLIAPSEVALTGSDSVTPTKKPSPGSNKYNKNLKHDENKPLSPIKPKRTNSLSGSTLREQIAEPKQHNKEIELKDTKKICRTAEFRKSIDKIYDLIHKLGQFDGNETKLCKSKFTAVTERAFFNDGAGETSTVQYSESGTSIKHNLTSSNPSSFSFDKIANPEEIKTNSKNKTPKLPGANVVPKVIINTRLQPTKIDNEKQKKDKRSLSCTSSTDNTLKAISQLLHEFDNAQKAKNKPGAQRKPEVTFADSKNDYGSTIKKPSKLESRYEHHLEKHVKGVPRERKYYKPPVPFQQQMITHKKKDVVDELKEARGEAVRGPSKLNSRLNSLAQPKKTYVKAQIEEFQARYGKNAVTDRLQKLTGSSNGQSTESTRFALKTKKRRDASESVYTISKASPSLVLEKSLKKHKSSNCDNMSPNDKCIKSHIEMVTSNLYKSTAVSINSENKSGRNILPQTGNHLVASEEQILRVPYIPNDIEIGSSSPLDSIVDTSSVLENEIHQIIDVIIPVNLHIDNDKKELHSQATNNPEDDLNTNPLHITPEDVERDKYHHNPGNLHEHPTKLKREYLIGDTIPEENEEKLATSINDNFILEKFKCAQNGQMPVKSLQKHLNLKNLALTKIATPNETLQQVLLLQSGDANSLILHSSMSQNLKVTTKEKDLKSLPNLNNLNWNFAQFPMQIPIIGYSFPKYNRVRSTLSTIPNKYPSTTHSEGKDATTIKSDKTIQCYKGGHLERNTEVDINEILKFANLLKVDSTLTIVKETANKEDEKEDIEIEENKTTDKYENIQDTKQKQLKPEHENKTEKSKTQQNLIQLLDAAPTKLETNATADKKHELSSVELLVEKDVPKDSSKHENTIAETVLKHNIEVNSTPSGMEYTRSLDVLVGLLNEIQCITSCQSQMASSTTDNTDKQREEIECILKSAAALEHVQQEARNIISIASLDKLRQLDSNGSILSFCISNNSRQDLIDNNFQNIELKPLCVDKEVSAIPTTFINNCTNVPSQLFPLKVSHSTHVTKSLLGILSEPSSQSFFAYNSSREYPLHGDASLTCIRKVVELPKEENDDTLRARKIISYTKSPENNMGVITKNIACKTELKKHYIINANFDPVMKMKRDILVTVYSVLVFTVFAALSFPEILYRS